jgi:hypothetical protein
MTHTWTALATQYQNKVPNSIFLQFANYVVLAWDLGTFNTPGQCAKHTRIALAKSEII